MQARLPDINNAFVKYRNVILFHLDMKDYEGCFAALFAINGLLPAEYRVQISTIEYNNATRKDILVKCNHCDQEFNYEKIKIYKKLLTSLESLILDCKTLKVWTCSNCKRDNDLFKTRMTQTVLKEPSFVKIIWNAPTRKDGLEGRTAWQRKAAHWVKTMLVELEAQLANYRDDNWKKEEQFALENLNED